jgi:Mrp family chromosome partitioning ATPase
VTWEEGSTASLNGVTSDQGSTASLKGVTSDQGPTASLNGVTSDQGPTASLKGVTSDQGPTASLNGVTSDQGPTASLNGVTSEQGPTASLNGVTSEQGPTASLNGVTSEQGPTASLLAFVWRRWLLFFLVSLPLAIGVAAYVYTLPSQYDAETTVAFAPRKGVQVGGDVVKVVLPRYVALLTAAATTERVAAEVGAPPELLEDADVSIAIDTANLTIVVRDANPELAAAGANGLAAAAVTAANRGDDLLKAQQVAVALPPTQPSAPPRGLLSAAGVVAALMAGFAAALLAERLQPRLRTMSDAAAATSLSVLGQIPTSKDLQKGRTTPATDVVIGSAMRSSVARAVQSSDVDPSLTDAMEHKVIGFTAPTYGHGKSSLAMAYAAAAARRGQRVVVVDADPAGTKSTSLMASQRPGEKVTPARRSWIAENVASVVSQKEKPDDGLIQGPVEGVLILREAVTPADGNAVAPGLDLKIKEMMRRADKVVIICPPLVNEDGLRVLAQLPAVLLIVRSGSLTADLAASAAQLDTIGARTLGAVLNRSGSGRRPREGWHIRRRRT